MTLKEDERAHIKLKNSLDEETTVHWHGLIVGGPADGEPHDVIKPGEEKDITFDVQQERATLWFHPHPLGYTAKQVYEGLAGLLYIEGDLDKEFTHGETDFPLIFQDRLFNDAKQLDYTYAYHPDGVLGDTMLINGTVNPKLTVPQEKVRLRLLNGSNMRNMTFSLSNGQAFQQIASDGGNLNEPLELKALTLIPSERAEVILDFSDLREAETVNLMTDDGTILLPFHVVKASGEKEKRDLVVDNTIALDDELANKDVSKELVLFGHGHHVTINGKKFDKDRIDFTQKKGETEIWEIYNEPDMMGGMIHPFHIHGTQFQVVSVNGEEPDEALRGFKDTVSVAPGDRIKIAVKFEEAGVYMYHCHILEHEDNGMMGQIKVQ